MKRYLSILSLVIAIAGLSSCDEDNYPSEQGAFEFAGIKFETLQRAMEAALDDPDGGDIKLLHDVRGTGAAVDGDRDAIVRIDFGEFKYLLDEGKTISTGGASAFLSGNGGSISGNGIIIVSEGGKLSISGDLDLTGDITTSSFTLFENDYCGDFCGNISLKDNEMYICSNEGRYRIPVLKVHGQDSFLQVEGYAAPLGQVGIGTVVSDIEHPVMANSESAVRVAVGTVPHIHKYTVEDIPANCMTPARIERTCTDCGYLEVEIKDDVLGKCPKETLVFVPAFQQGENFGGMLGHWECPLCGRCYSDPEGEHEITGPVTLLANNYFTDYALLHDLDDVFDWRNEFRSNPEQLGAAIEIAGLVLTVVGLVETLGLSIPGLVADDSDKWDQVNGKLDAIQESLDRIEYKIDQLAEKVDAVAYKNLIVERNQKINFLSSKSATAFNLICKYLKDESLSDAQKEEKIALTLLDWSENQFNGTMISDLTESLMQQYVNTGLDKNVPGMFEAVANCSYLWEHDGYNFRYQVLARESVLTSISYLMSCYYISSVKEYNNEDLRELELQSMKNCYKSFSDAVKTELDRIKERDGKYRRYNPASVTFSIFAESYDFRGWFEKHKDRQFPRENQDGRAVASCDAILNDLGLNKDMALTLDIAKEIYDYYNRNNSNPTSIYHILRDSVGFRHIPDGFDPGIIFVKRTDKFSHDNDDVAIPTYKIFHWEIYRSHNNEDNFGIRSCLNDRCVQENHNILYQCDISSYSSGEINSLGSKTRWQWYTLVKGE